MKIFDERISNEAINEIAEELASNLEELIYEDYRISLGAETIESVSLEFRAILDKIFNVDQ